MSRVRFQISYLIAALFLFFCIPIWIFVISPELKKLPSNFSYTADILSLDNFYDEKIKRFEGEHISKTTFHYKIIEKKRDYLVIENSFTVRKLSDAPIFSVTRLYYIDPYTGQHLSQLGQKRSGYLFGPQYVNKHDFYYWHINYDAPAPMKFINEEKIYGLNVNHYQANYEADQTANLGYLTDVPEKYGVKTQINLQLWIEPISGWLVKYRDNTLAYYYDLKTGEKLFPWNQFSNRYTQISVKQQVKIATRLKWKILIIDYGVPLLLIILAIFLVYMSFQKKPLSIFQFKVSKLSLNKKRKILMNSALVILFGFALIISYLIIQKDRSSFFTIGISEWNVSPNLTESVRGFKDGLDHEGFKEGKNVNYIIENPRASIENQIDIIQFFKTQKVDLIFTLTTPGTLIAKGITSKTPIVFAEVTYPVKSNIIDAFHPAKNYLVGSRNYISAAQQFFMFEKLYPHTKKLGFIYHKGDPDSEILLNEFKNMLSKRNIQIMDIPAVDFDDLKRQLQQPSSFDAVYLACDTLIQAGGSDIVAKFSLKNRIPSFSCDKNSVAKGILVAYVSDPYVMGKIAGKKAALLLQGAEPGWLQVDSPDTGFLVINRETAKLLGITIPVEMQNRIDGAIGKINEY